MSVSACLVRPSNDGTIFNEMRLTTLSAATLVSLAWVYRLVVNLGEWKKRNGIKDLPKTVKKKGIQIDNSLSVSLCQVVI